MQATTRAKAYRKHSNLYKAIDTTSCTVVPDRTQTYLMSCPAGLLPKHCAPHWALYNLLKLCKTIQPNQGNATATARLRPRRWHLRSLRAGGSTEARTGEIWQDARVERPWPTAG